MSATRTECPFWCGYVEHFGVPAESGARVAVETIRAAATDVEWILLVAYDDEWATRWTRLLGTR
jgi:hypothetical protein